MKPASARHRPDVTSKALTAEAQRLGVGLIPLGGTIDVALYLGQVVRLVDFKGVKKTLTPSQQRLVSSGCPIHFCSTIEQMQLLVKQIKQEAGL